MASVRAIEITETPKLWLYAGASGAKGTADPTGLPTDYATFYGTEVDLSAEQVGVPWGYNFDGPNESQAINAGGLQPRSTQHGWDLSLGAELAAMPGHNVALAGYARGGVTLAVDWLGTVGTNARTFFDAQRALLSPAHAVKGHIWNVNNSDAGNQTYAEAYAANMATMVASMRGMTGCSAMHVYVIRAHVDGDAAYTSTVRTQQAAFVASDGNATLVDQDSCELDVGNVHLTQAGLITLGGIVFDAIRDHEFNP
jgi:hypothetical protein